MGKQIVQGGLALFAGYDLTSDVNAVALSLGADAVEITSLADTSHIFMPGLKTVKASVKGFWDSTIDGVIIDTIGGADVLSLALTQAEGGIGFFARQMPAQYQIGDQVDKVFPFSLTVNTEGQLVRGLIMARKSAIAATGHGSPFQVGAVTALQSIYCALHVTKITGTTVSITCALESNADNTFGSPTTHITFDAVTDVTEVMAQLLSTAGAITDTWWRLKYTISGTGSFDFTALAGVL